MTAAAMVAAAVAPAGGAALTALSADTAHGRPARVLMTFSGGLPSYRIYGNGSSDVSLVLVGTSRATNAAAAINGKDSLKSVTFESIGDSLEVTFHQSGPSTLVINPGNGASYVATITAKGPSSGNFGAVPPAQPATPAPDAAANSGDDDEVVPLKYADVGEVVGLLVPGQQITSNDTFVAQEQNFGSTGLGGGSVGGFGGVAQPIAASSTNVAAGGTLGSGAILGQQITDHIGIDRRLNAIVLTGSPSLIARIKRKIAKLDVALPSVVLETQVVELTDTAARDVGIDFTNAGGPTISATYQIKSLGTGTGSATLQAAVYAQILRGEGKTIARPRIVAQNGSSAQILTGDALPIVTSIAVSGVNAVSQQVQYVNVGVNLQIQPRISADGFVTSHIFSEVSNVTGYQQGYPTLSQREATTSATVHDGDSFVIGGLLQQNEISNLSKVPGIGDLPLIGGLFRVRHNTSQSTNLYIIVTPHILTTGAPRTPGAPLPVVPSPLPSAQPGSELPVTR